VIRIATESDLPGIMAMVGLAVAQMLAEGSDQWSESYPSRADFSADIGRGELFVEAVDEGPIDVRAVACLNREEPEEYGSVRWSREGRATVVHRLAVHPDCRGRGFAKGLFLFAEDLARRNGTEYIRSDTYSLNARMNALFSRMGYARTGVIAFPRHRAEFYCYDKVIGEGR
jgi:GNAT superfamily N-acetyltransferase